ncbi:MAG: hypothetical protein HQK51_02235 [Oligoflexia bacterium]|nr:hypothetical protein [Oligoflexia bacterium]
MFKEINFSKSFFDSFLFRRIHFLLVGLFGIFLTVTLILIYKIHYNFYSEKTLEISNVVQIQNKLSEIYIQHMSNENDVENNLENINVNSYTNTTSIEKDFELQYVYVIDSKLSNIIKKLNNRKFSKGHSSTLLAEKKFLKNVREYKRNKEDIVKLIDELVENTSASNTKISYLNNINNEIMEINGDELISHSSIATPAVEITPIEAPILLESASSSSVDSSLTTTAALPVLLNLASASNGSGGSADVTNEAIFESPSISSQEKTLGATNNDNNHNNDGLIFYDYSSKTELSKPENEYSKNIDKKVDSSEYPIIATDSNNDGPKSKDTQIQSIQNIISSKGMKNIKSIQNTQVNNQTEMASSKNSYILNNPQGNQGNNAFTSNGANVSKRVDATIKNVMDELDNRKIYLAEVDNKSNKQVDYDLVDYSYSGNTKMNKYKGMSSQLPSSMLYVNYDYKKGNKVNIGDGNYKRVNAFAPRGYLSTVTLKTYNVFLDQGKRSEEETSFDFRPFYASNNVINDSGDGKIVLKNKISSTMNILSGTILKNSQIPTNVSLVLSPGAFIYSIPSFDIDSFSKFLDKNKIVGKGGFILVDLDEKTVDIDADAEYEAKVYFNNDFKIVKSENDAQYLMLLGVTPGNRILSFKTYEGRTVKKVVHVSEDEILFESNAFVSKGAVEYDLYYNNLFERMKSNLNISAKKIKYFNENGKGTKKLGINHYEISNILLPIGTRVYTEFNHLRENIFVGRWDNGEIQLPSNEYINQIFNVHGIYTLNGSCIIQINLDKRIKSFMAEGKALEGLNLDIRFLNYDGSFTEMVSDLTNRIFIFGDTEGVVNFKVDYLDGTRDIVETYCSRDTYLVEQL